MSIEHRENLRVSEAAEFYGVHPTTIKRRIREGKLPAYRIGGTRQLRIRRKDLVALMERVPVDPDNTTD